MNSKPPQEHAQKAYVEFMKDAVASFAPGRIEFLGNHLDYNGGVVLGTAINAGIYALAQPRKDSSYSLFSESFEGSEITGSIEKIEKLTGAESWGNYCLGVLHVLQKKGLAPDKGFSLTLTTDLPMSAGLSSSAAVELATCQCLLQLAKQEVPKEELVKICRQAENEWVGLPCGILDQGTSAFGEKNQLVQIDCDNEKYTTLPLPANTRFWIFDSGIKHDLVDSLYGTRNQECMDALQILQKVKPDLQHLAMCPIPLIQNAVMRDDIRKRALHVVQEQERVHKFTSALKDGVETKELGPFLTSSHQSSSTLFENSMPELDFLVDLLTEGDDVLGARLTGGGFGGAVLAWTTKNFSQSDAEVIANSYQQKWGSTPAYHSFYPSKGASVIDPLSENFKPA